MSDVEDLAAYQTHRDAESFRRLVLRYQGMVYSTCCRALGNLSEAEDAAQETFLKLAQSAGSIQSNLGAWLHSCARSAARHRRESARARRRREETWSQMQRLENVEDWRDLAPVVDDCIAELPEDDRELLVQHYFVGRTQTDLAAERGISRQAVAKQLERVVGMVRQGLRCKGVTVSIAVLGAFLTESTSSAAVPASLTASLCKIGVAGVSGTSCAATAGVAGMGVLGGKSVAVVAAAAIAVLTGTAVYRHRTERRPGDVIEVVAPARASPAANTSGRTALAGVVAAPHVTGRTAAPATVTIRFPEDRSVGWIEVRGQRPRREARGAVELPRDAEVEFGAHRKADITASILGELGSCRLVSLDLSRARLEDDSLASLGLVASLRVLKLDDTAVTDAGMVHIGALKSLQGLFLGRTRVGDAGLVHLKQLQVLRKLSLGKTLITDEGLGRLAALTSLDELWLGHTAITDEGLAHLSTFPALQRVHLMWTGITDRGLAHIGRLQNLCGVDLFATKISDAGLAHLRGLGRLDRLMLGHTAITDEGLREVATFGSLKCLQTSALVTDAGVAHLRRLKNLERLYLRDAKVSPRALAELREALPQCTIEAPDGTKKEPRSTKAARSRSVPARSLGPLQFTLKDLFGRTVCAEDYRGAPVLVMAGACWCGGCQQDAAPFGRLARDYGRLGLQLIRSVSGDNELAALEFQRHYRLPVVMLMDPTRAFEKRYNRDGWTFLMLADGEGKVVHAANNSVERERPALDNLLAGFPKDLPPSDVQMLEGVPYMPATLARSGEGDIPRRRDWFPSIACGHEGRVQVAFTSNRRGNTDVFIRTFDGGAWSPDQQVAATEEDEFDGTVVADARGRTWVCWTSKREGGAYDVYVARRNSAGDGWERMRVTRSQDDAMHGRMACDAEGRLWVTYYKWARREGVSRDKEVFVRSFDGEAWSAEVQVSPTDVPWYEDHCDPVVAALGDGRAVVSWSWDYHRPPNYPREANAPTVFVRTIGRDLGLGPIRVVSGSSIDTMPAITATAGERLWCAWESIVWDRRAGMNRKEVCVRECMLREGAGAPAAARGWQSLGGRAHNVCTPRVVVGQDGTVTAVWAQDTSGDRWELRRADLRPGENRWSEPTALVTEGNPRFPAVDLGPDGALWVAYSAETRIGREVRVFRDSAASSAGRAKAEP